MSHTPIPDLISLVNKELRIPDQFILIGDAAQAWEHSKMFRLFLDVWNTHSGLRIPCQEFHAIPTWQMGSCHITQSWQLSRVAWKFNLVLTLHHNGPGTKHGWSSGPATRGRPHDPSGDHVRPQIICRLVYVVHAAHCKQPVAPRVRALSSATSLLH